MSSLLIMDDATASLKNLDVQMLLKTDLQPPTLPHVHHIHIAELQRHAAPNPADDQPPRVLQASKQKQMSVIWEELIFLDKEMGQALQRFVFDKPYSFLFACADTNMLYQKCDHILIKNHHAPAEEDESPEAEEG